MTIVKDGIAEQLITFGGPTLQICSESCGLSMISKSFQDVSILQETSIQKMHLKNWRQHLAEILRQRVEDTQMIRILPTLGDQDPSMHLGKKGRVWQGPLVSPGLTPSPKHVATELNQ